MGEKKKEGTEGMIPWMGGKGTALWESGIRVVTGGLVELCAMPPYVREAYR